MAAGLHVIDAGDGASPLLACAVRAVADADGCKVVALGDSSGRALLSRGGLSLDAWAGMPCRTFRFAARPLARAARAACDGHSPSGATCWSADPERAQALVRCVRRAFGTADAHAGALGDAICALSPRAETEAPPREAMRESIGARAGSMLVMAAADAPRCANTGRMLDVVGRAMLAGLDVHLVVPECMPHVVRTWRYARGLGLEARVHVIEGAEWPVPWWSAADAVLVTDESPLVCSVASSVGIRFVRALGRPDDASSPERRAASAAARDAAASALIDAARGRPQSAMNASAASA